MGNETLGGFREFLEYGPLGLAGLMLVLVVFALTTGTLNEARERTLRLFMFVGAFCFIAVLAAQFFSQRSEHELQLIVAPNDLGEESSFPPPIIKVNGKRVDRTLPVVVAAQTTLLVDVTDALGVYKATATRVEVQNEAIAQAQRVTAELQAELSRTPANVPAVFSSERIEMLTDTNRRLERALRR